MDNFHTSAKEFELVNLFITGATFGIFYSFGQAWTVFVQSVVVAITPTDFNPVIKELIFACMTSFICISLILCIVYIDRQIKQMNKKLSSRLQHRKLQYRSKMHSIKVLQRSAKK